MKVSEHRILLSGVPYWVAAVDYLSQKACTRDSDGCRVVDAVRMISSMLAPLSRSLNDVCGSR